MRKTLTFALALVLALAAVSVCRAELYHAIGRVIDVDRWEDCITIADEKGNTWLWDQFAEDWDEGDYVALTLDDCGTATTLDDDLWDVQYLGYGW